MKSLAEYLGTAAAEDTPADAASTVEASDPARRLTSLGDVDFEHLDAKEFADAFLSSLEFRRYLVNMLALGEMPAAIITRMMDHAWGRPVEHVEHKVAVSRIERVIVDAPSDAKGDESYTTH